MSQYLKPFPEHTQSKKVLWVTDLNNSPSSTMTLTLLEPFSNDFVYTLMFLGRVKLVGRGGGTAMPFESSCLQELSVLPKS